jgi:hypothetical protein
MHVLGMLLGRVFYLSVAAVVAAIVACFLRRLRLALTLSRAVTFMGVAAFVASAVALAALRSTLRAEPDPTTVATLLGEISEIVSCGALASLVAIPGAVVWLVARSRLRRGA